MKKLFLMLGVIAGTILLFSCEKDDHDDKVYTEIKSIENRAEALGYESVAAYQDSVAAQHNAGNHVNCDSLADGTHQACAYENHSGASHDGKNHNGTGHGTNHNEGSHNGGNHNGGSNHGHK